MRFVRTAENLFGLPLGFTRVEYLQSSGTQWIDTGIAPSNITPIVKLKFIPTQQYSSGSYGIFGCFGANNTRFQIFYNSIGIGTYVSKAWQANTTYEVELNGKIPSATINGNVETSGYSTANGFSSDNMYLFTRNNGNVADNGVPLKLYYCKIWDNNTLVRDFIPCIDPLGVACMYDLVGKKPYYNIGTGTFTVGRQVIPVEYLESSGEQYIDTGYKPVPATTKFEFYFSPTTISGNYFLFGTRPNTSIGGETCTTYFATGNIRQDWAGLGSYFTKTNVGDKALYSAYNNTVSLNNNSVTGTVVRSTDRSNYNFLLFTVNTAGTVDSRMFVGKVYYAKLWDNGTLVRDYIPCKDENDVGFMFDTLSGTVYLNAGTGAFSVGENKYTSKLRLIKDAIRIPEGYTRVEYLESTGTQYIDTGYIPTNTTGVQVRHTICADNSKDNIVFGCREGSGDTRFWEDIDWTNSDTIGWGFNSYSSTTAGTRFPISGMAGQTIVSSMNFMNDRAGRVNGVPYDTSLETKTLITITRPICLFAANYAGTMSLFTACKIFSCQISEGSTLVRSFIPVRDENNVGYMFDEVTGQLFSNAGSGSFGIGNDLPTAKVRFIQDVLPREYRPLKYLESSGTQYILTGFTPTINTDFELELSSTDTLTRWVIGCPTWVGVHYKGVDGQIGITNSSTSDFQQYVNYARDNTRITMKLSGDTVYANGVSLGTITRRAGTLDFALFGYRDANRGATLLFTGSIYKCIIWDNGVLVRDLYPALRKSDNKPGMYDRITKQFFTNASISGNDFNYG